MRRGRPEKYPDRDPERERANLIARAAELYEEPYDDRKPRKRTLPTIASVAEVMQLDRLAVRKLLITANMYSTERSRVAQALYRSGASVDEIGKKLEINHAAVISWLPYGKGSYKLKEPSLNAEQCREYHMRNRAVKQLSGSMSARNGESLALWKAVIAFEGYGFRTSGRSGKDGVRFHYEVSRSSGGSGRHFNGESVEGYGNELWIVTDGKRKKKSVSRSTVDLAYRKAREMGGQVKGPKALCTPGAGSYLFPMLKRFGVIEISETPNLEIIPETLVFSSTTWYSDENCRDSIGTRKGDDCHGKTEGVQEQGEDRRDGER